MLCIRAVFLGPSQQQQQLAHSSHTTTYCSKAPPPGHRHHASDLHSGGVQPISHVSLWYCSKCEIGGAHFITHLVPLIASFASLGFASDPDCRIRSWIFVIVGHKTTYSSSGKNHIFTKSCHRQTYKYQIWIIPQRLQHSDFKVIFQHWKSVKSFQVLKNSRLGDKLLLMIFLKTLTIFF